MISTIVICFNANKYIKNCIDSITDQIQKTDELIVIDGNSTDGTFEFLSSKKNIAVLKQQGKGIGDARNQGILKAKGEYIAFLDADDRWSKEKLLIQSTFLHNNPLIDAVGGHLVRSDNCTKSIPAMTPGAFLFKKEVFNRFGLFETKWKVAADHEWFIRAIRLGFKYCLLNEVVLFKTIHERNISINFQQIYKREVMEILHRSTNLYPIVSKEN